MRPGTVHNRWVLIIKSGVVLRTVMNSIMGEGPVPPTFIYMVRLEKRQTKTRDQTTCACEIANP
jgi:hypothetical protein